MVTKSVLVFDICSSTSILVALHADSAVDLYFTLIEQIGRVLRRDEKNLGFVIYKFIGDGFILLFSEETSIDAILLYFVRLVTRCDAILRDFISDQIPDAEMTRIGITGGLDRGWLVEKKLMGVVEYIGRPINVACRLQAALDRPEQANTLMLPNTARAKLKDADLRTACFRTKKKLKNVDAKERYYFEFEPFGFRNQKWTRKGVNDAFANIIADDETAGRRLRGIFENASTPNISIFKSWLNSRGEF